VLSLQRIKETADPTRQEAVQKRTMGMGDTQATPTVSESFNDAKTRKEIAQAEMAEIELATMRKNLLDAAEVRLFANDLGATFRAALESLPDRLAHELVPLTDADEIRAVLVDTFEQLLGDLSLKIGKMSA
jgi:phage terminase Nu1 subunit (DNA packaging protein)